jgi:hypothetical protein
MSLRIQNLLSVVALVAAMVITLLPENSSTPSREVVASAQAGPLSR